MQKVHLCQQIGRSFFPAGTGTENASVSKRAGKADIFEKSYVSSSKRGKAFPQSACHWKRKNHTASISLRMPFVPSVFFNEANSNKSIVPLRRFYQNVFIFAKPPHSLTAASIDINSKLCRSLPERMNFHHVKTLSDPAVCFSLPAFVNSRDERRRALSGGCLGSLVR